MAFDARENIHIIQQVGVEATPGTPVVATKRFTGLTFVIGTDIETKTFRAQGYKSNTTSVVHRRLARGTYSGPLSYVEICYALAGLVPFTVTPGASSSQVWVFTPNAQGSDTPKTYTLEDGDDADVEQYPHVLISSFNLEITLEEANVSGDCFAMTETTTLALLTTSGISQLAERPVAIDEVDVYMNDTFATIGTTKLTDPLAVSFAMGEKFQPKFVLNTTYKSFKSPKEVIPGETLTLLIEHNAQGRALIDAINTGNPLKFFRVACTSAALIAAGIPYKIWLDFCGKVTAVRKVPDAAGGIYAYEYTFGSQIEPTIPPKTTQPLFEILPIQHIT